MSPTLQSLGIRPTSPRSTDRLGAGHLGTIAAKPGRPLLTEAQRRELERRIADDDANPDDVVPWEQVKAQAISRLKP